MMQMILHSQLGVVTGRFVPCGTTVLGIAHGFVTELNDGRLDAFWHMIQAHNLLPCSCSIPLGSPCSPSSSGVNNIFGIIQQTVDTPWLKAEHLL